MPTDSRHTMKGLTIADADFMALTVCLSGSNRQGQLEQMIHEIERVDKLQVDVVMARPVVLIEHCNLDEFRLLLRCHQLSDFLYDGVESVVVCSHQLFVGFGLRALYPIELRK